VKKNAGGRSAETNKNLTRRGLLGGAAAAASMLPLLNAQQAAPEAVPSVQPPAAGGGRGGGRGGPRITPGGTGPIKVLFVSKYHPFDRENLFLTLDSMGKDITWTHIEQPASGAFFDPKLAAAYDVFLHYDGYAGRVTKTNPDGTTTNEYTSPPDVE
jgi:hypothetical protein